MRFSGISELANLPYFKLVDGQLYLKKNALSHDVFDMHTHLGWHYLFAPPVDLWGRTEIRHFFPSDIPIQTDRYTAYDYTKQAKKICQREILRGTYDTHGYTSTHTIPNILAEMDRLRIRKAAVLAVDYPILSHNTSELLKAVSKTKESKERLVLFASVHPFQANKTKLLQAYVKQGALGIKLHPQMQLFQASTTFAYPIYSFAAEHHIPVLFHTGLSPLSPSWQRPFVDPKDYETVFARFPRTLFVIGHAGGVEGYRWAARMAKKYPRVYVETSGQPPRGIEYLVTHMDTDKILYGTDWPFYPMVLPFAKTLLATEKHKKIRSKIFWENAQKLLYS